MLSDARFKRLRRGQNVRYLDQEQEGAYHAKTRLLHPIFRIWLNHIHQLPRVGLPIPGGYKREGRERDILQRVGERTMQRLRELRYQTAGLAGKIFFPL